MLLGGRRLRCWVGGEIKDCKEGESWTAEVDF